MYPRPKKVFVQDLIVVWVFASISKEFLEFYILFMIGLFDIFKRREKKVPENKSFFVKG